MTGGRRRTARQPLGRGLLVGTVALLGCAPPPPPEPPPRPRPRVRVPEPPPPLMTASVDALPVPVFGAVVRVVDRDTVTVTLSSQKIGCDDGSPEEDEERIVMSLVRELGRPDAWRMVRLAVRADGEGEQTFPIPKAPVVRLPDELGETARVRTTFNAPVAFGPRDTRRVEVLAPVDAKVCGSWSEPPASPWEGFEVWVGDEKLPLAGATYTRDRASRRHLVSLSTEPLACDADPEAAAVSVVVALDNAGRSAETVVLGGTRVGESTGGQVQGEAIRSALAGRGQAVMVSLDGEADVGGYSVLFRGDLTAQLCR